MVEALIAHVAAQHATVGGQPRSRDAEVVVDLEDLPGERRQLRRRPLQRRKHHMRLALRTAISFSCDWRASITLGSVPYGLSPC